MPILHLGVIDFPYSAPAGSTRPGKGGRVAIAVETTGAVATWLEDKYHVIESFWELHRDEFVAAIENSLSGAIESMMMGAPLHANPLAGALSGMDEKFKDFLSRAEIEGLGIPGVPTKAALDGVNHRLKSKRGARRPSFIDTGTYQASFRAWVDENAP